MAGRRGALKRENLQRHIRPIGLLDEPQKLVIHHRLIAARSYGGLLSSLSPAMGWQPGCYSRRSATSCEDMLVILFFGEIDLRLGRV
jgi:hypothetical protein